MINNKWTMFPQKENSVRHRKYSMSINRKKKWLPKNFLRAFDVYGVVNDFSAPIVPMKQAIFKLYLTLL